MELDTFMLAIEDFLEGRLKSDYLKEEFNYFKEEFEDYKDKLNNSAGDNIKKYEAIEEGLKNIYKYFNEKEDTEYIEHALKIFRDYSSEADNNEVNTLDKPPEHEILIKKKFEKLSAAKGQTEATRLPPRNYFVMKEKEDERQSAPIDSPLYTLLLNYKEMVKNKDNKAWLKELLEAEEELNYLFEQTEDLPSDVSEDKADEFRKALLKTIKLIEDLQIDVSESDSQELENKVKGPVTELEELNFFIYNIKQELFPETLILKEEPDEKELEHISSPDPEFCIPSGMKSKEPPRVYYEKPKDREGEKVDYVSDPVDSPFYSLLSSYQEFLANKIEKSVWHQRLEETEEEFNYLIKKTEESLDEADELRNLLEEAGKLVSGLRKEFLVEKTEDFDYQVNGYIDEIRIINLDIYNIQQETIYEEETFDIKDSILEACELFTDEDFKTDNYLMIEEHIYGFLNDEVEKGVIVNIINEMKFIISNAQEEYEELPVTEEELTLEVLRGDRLLNEGFMAWMEGLSIIEEALDIEDEEYLLEGLEYIFNGNKKLVLVQYFSEQVQKLAQREQSFKPDIF